MSGKRQKCPQVEMHTPEPERLGYLDWVDWREEMSKTHEQQKCPGCGLWKIWVPRPTSPQCTGGKTPKALSSAEVSATIEEGCAVGVHELMRSRDDGRSVLFVCALCGYEEHEIQGGPAG